MESVPGALVAVGLLGALLYRGGAGLEGVAFSVGLAALYGAVLCGVGARAGDARPIPAGTLALGLTLWWGWLGFCVLWSPLPEAARYAFWVLGCAPLAFWSLIAAPSPGAAWRLAFRAALAIGVILAAYASWQFAVERIQARSLFLNPNSHAALLNLLTLPAAALYLAAPSPEPRRSSLLRLATLALLFYSVATVHGRAATASLGLGLGLLALATVRVGLTPLRARRGGALAGVCAAAFLAASVWVPGDTDEVRPLAQRLTQVVQEPGQATAARRLMWGVSLEILRDAPWYGTGLGTYHYLYLPRRAYAERSSGYHAHNDYLEIAIEAGIPGLALVLLLGLAVARSGVRLLGSRTPPPIPDDDTDSGAPRTPDATRLEAAGILAGLLAVAAHSFFSFNFYQPGILVVVGLLLGRLQLLDPPRRDVAPAGGSSRLALASIAVACAVLLASSARAGLVAWTYHLATSSGSAAAADEIERLLRRAERLEPGSEVVLVGHAQLCRMRIETEPRLPPDARAELLSRGLAYFDRALHANPYRADTWVSRASLYQRDPDVAASRKLAVWEETYRRTLALDPRRSFDRARFAELLLRAGRRDEARELLEEGLRYDYAARQPALLELLSLTAWLRFEAGEIESAEALARRVDALRARLRLEPDFLERLRRSSGREPSPAAPAP